MAGIIVSGEPADERFVDGQRRIEARGFVLREVLHDDLMALDALAAVGWLLGREQPHQRRLAGAVVADERDAIAALDVEIDASSTTLSP